MNDILHALPLAFIPLFIAIDIFAVLPVFMAMTHDLSHARQHRVIRESILTALIVGLVFAGLGEVIFRILGITADDFKIAGGLVLLVYAVLDLTRQAERKRIPGRFGVVPIGVPLIVGPAVLTTILVLIDHYGVPATVISFLMNLLIVWFFLRRGPMIIKIFGQGGIMAISKVMALLLASIAVMMIRIGIGNIISSAAP